MFIPIFNNNKSINELKDELKSFNNNYKKVNNLDEIEFLQSENKNLTDTLFVLQNKLNVLKDLLNEIREQNYKIGILLDKPRVQKYTSYDLSSYESRYVDVPLSQYIIDDLIEKLNTR